MQRDVLAVLEKAQWLQEQLDRIEECLDQLEPEEQEVLEILQEGRETATRICDCLGVSKATAYRVKSRVLRKVAELFQDYRVRLK